MTDREQVEEEIRHVLAAATGAIPLSNQLFRPDGLFSRLADTEAERRAVARSPLFREAQKRLSELRRRDGEEFARVARQAEAAHPGWFWMQMQQPKNS
jgi:hypothetical protein